MRWFRRHRSAHLGQLPPAPNRMRPAVPPTPPVPTGKFGSLIGPVVQGIVDVLRDHRGKVSSRRCGAGALMVAGIMLVTEGAASHNTMQFHGGLALCGMAVLLFALTLRPPFQ